MSKFTDSSCPKTIQTSTGRDWIWCLSSNHLAPRSKMKIACITPGRIKGVVTDHWEFRNLLCFEMSFNAPQPYNNPDRDRFHANLKKRSPLTTIDNVKAHLKLSGAFLKLLEPLGPSEPLVTPSGQLHIFLSRAVHRLALYLDNVLGPVTDTQSLERKALPPLDVALVLHSYVLSPHRFFEDSIIRFPQLSAAKEFPVIELVVILTFF